MNQRLWRIAAESRAYAADDLTGAGAGFTGGRWNEVGTPIVYSSTSRALACLETVVHLDMEALPFNRYLVEIGIPDDIWSRAETASPASLEVGWDAEPPGLVSVGIGTRWAESERSALLLVPSVVVPEEFNVLINPAHPDTNRMIARKVRRWIYDFRVKRRA